jgi:hypothetical protein
VKIKKKGQTHLILLSRFPSNADRKEKDKYLFIYVLKLSMEGGV